MKLWVDECQQYFEPTMEPISIVIEQRGEVGEHGKFNITTELYKIEQYRDEFGNKVKTKTFIGYR